MAVMRVRLYRNLSPQYRNQRAWSILAYEGPAKGKVIDVVDGAVLKDAKLVISEAGRQRVIRERSKNVHAFVDGTLVRAFPLDSLDADATGEDLAPRAGATVRISYDPYKAGHFVRFDCMRPVYEASVAVVAPAGVYAKLPSCAASLKGLFDMSGLDPDDWAG